MADQRYTILVEDKVAGSIPTKLSDISTRATAAGTAVERLKAALSSIDTNAINQLAGANSKLQATLNANQLAAQKLATEQQRTATAAQNLATAAQRTATAQTQGSIAAQNLAAASARASSAQTQGQTAAARLATEQQRTAVQTANAAAAQDRAALAALRLQQAQARVVSTSRQVGTAIDGVVRSLLPIIAAAEVVKFFYDLSNASTTLSNKLKIVTDTEEQTAALTQRLYDIANRTRSPIEDVATSFARLDNALVTSGKSQEETLRLQETLNKLFVIGGSTASEQSNALLQLSQAFNAGKLQGDEFRSLMENMPRQVRTAIAQALGVNEASLKQLSSEGKITADVLFRAFSSMDKFADSKFAETVPTLAQSFTVLKNQAIEAFAAFDKNTGFTSALASFIQAIPSGLGKVIDGIDAIGALLRAIGVFIIRWNVQLVDAFKNAAIDAYNAVVQFVEDVINKAISGVNYLREHAGLQAYDFVDFKKISTEGREQFEGFGELWARTLDESFADQAQSGLRSLFRSQASEARNTLLRGAGPSTVNSSVDAKRAEALRRVNADLDAQVARLFMLQPLREQQAQFDKIELDLKKKNIDLTSSEAESIRAKIATIAEATRVQGKYDEIYKAAIGPSQDYGDTLKAADMLLKQAAISQKDYDRTVTSATETYLNAIDPLREINRQMSQQEELLNLLPAQREIEQQMQQIANEMLSKGIILTKQEADALRDRLQIQQQLNIASQAEAQVFDNTIGKRQQYIAQLDAINKLKGQGLTAGDVASSVAAANPDLDFANTQTGIDTQVQQFADMYARIDALRQKDLINEQTAAALRAQVWAKQQDAQLNTASTFFTSLSQLSKSENTKIAAIGKAAAITQATIDTYRAATGAYAALAGIPYVGPYLGAAAAAAAIVAGMAQVNAIRNQSTGFMLGGYTGDVGRSQVAGAVHGQEYVMDANTTARIGKENLDALRSGAARIQGPSQTSPATPANSNASGGGMNQRIINVFDRGIVADYMNTPEGEDLVVNVIRRNAETVRAAVST